MSLSFYTPLASLLLSFFLLEHYQIESISKNCKLANVLISCLYDIVHMPCVERGVLITDLVDLSVLHLVRSVVTITNI